MSVLSQDFLPFTSWRRNPPEKTTPSKAPLVKALPTVRDHTTDQLNEARDKYIPKEFDDAGEKKVDANGNLQGDREYRCRTFTVPLREKKLDHIFMTSSCRGKERRFAPDFAVGVYFPLL
ncbi:hypothetical protein BDW74DRAFT_180974 [Aspergillus multicolor]|uniref:uncharacterized protein n=1 Tax=Aspergillus multicolor TaxID=41759 RepID=UPI003CCD0D6E